MGVARTGGAVVNSVLVGDHPWVAAWVPTQMIVKTTVTLFTILNYMVSTEAWKRVRILNNFGNFFHIKLFMMFLLDCIKNKLMLFVLPLNFAQSSFSPDF